MEGDVRRHEPVKVAGLVMALHLRDRGLHLLGVLWSVAAGGESCGAGFHHAPNLDEAAGNLVVRVAVRRSLDDGVEAGPVVCRIHKRAAAGLDVQDVLRPECLQRFAGGQPADVVGPGDVGFRRQCVVRLQPAVEYVVQQTVDEVVNKCSAPHRLPYFRLA